MASITLKIALFTPNPSASVAIATIVNPGLFARVRPAYRMARICDMTSAGRKSSPIPASPLVKGESRRLPKHKHKHRFQAFFRDLGPGLITGAADDDPSGISTY